jgi:hypothetical protein
MVWGDEAREPEESRVTVSWFVTVCVIVVFVRDKHLAGEAATWANKSRQLPFEQSRSSRPTTRSHTTHGQGEVESRNRSIGNGTTTQGIHAKESRIYPQMTNEAAVALSGFDQEPTDA